jgi:uncharacterized RDD family membrane protein YckC
MSGCYKCGSEQGNEARLCPDCNAKRLKKQETIADEIDEAKYKTTIGKAGQSAGFWLRFFGNLVDLGIIGFLQALITWAIMLGAETSLAKVAQGLFETSGATLNLMVMLVLGTAILILLNLGIMILVSAVYRPFFESSAMRATPGKLLFKLQVVDLAGQRLSLGIALLREAGRHIYLLVPFAIMLLAVITSSPPSLGMLALIVLSPMAVALIQYGMVGFRLDKKALHDLISKSRVLVGAPTESADLFMRVAGSVLMFVFFGLLVAALNGRLEDKKSETPSYSQGVSF